MTSMKRRRLRRVLPRLVAFNGSFRSRREAANAGARPKITAVSMAMASVARRTGVFSRITASSGKVNCGSSAIRPLNSARANRHPTAAPARANSALSTISCRMMRARLAPSASRSTSSFSRVLALASSRFATFAQAISSSNPTAASRV